MEKYTVRITKENDSFVAWIDQDGAICIRQDLSPKTNLAFASEQEASDWANEHAKMLTATYLDSVANAAQTKADLALERAYKEAVILSVIKDLE